MLFNVVTLSEILSQTNTALIAIKIQQHQIGYCYYSWYIKSSLTGAELYEKDVFDNLRFQSSFSNTVFVS